MVEDFEAISSFDSLATCDVTIVGTGPLGLALAHACLVRGFRVMMLESGGRNPDQQANALSRAAKMDGTAHVPLEEGCARVLGGNSHLWGGRCVPFDAIDFEKRDYIPFSGWPIPYAEVARWYAEASQFLKCSQSFKVEPIWPHSDAVRFDTIESWMNDSNVSTHHNSWIENHQNLTIVTRATVTDFVFDENVRRVVAIRATDGTRTVEVPVRRLVVACGGVQTPRLLLAVQRAHPNLFGGPEGPLGRYYMGHVSGKLAELKLAVPEKADTLDYMRAETGFLRRRITLTEAVQREERLGQISFSSGNAVVYDSSHRSGALSLLWFILASPLGARFVNAPLRSVYLGETKPAVWPHLMNVLREPIATISGVWSVYTQMFRQRPKKPSVFLPNKDGRYTLYYHGEQSPNPENRITLSEEVDAVGMPRANVAFNFSHADAEYVASAHKSVEKAVKELGIGGLVYSVPEENRVAAILSQARDGLHQIGATRMSDDPTTGVVDSDLKAFGLDNFYIASTSVMPTSGHANPTFVGVALARRLAAHLTGDLERHVDGAPETLVQNDVAVAAMRRFVGEPSENAVKVLVTGASGFVGRAVCDLLRSRGHTIRALTSRRDQADTREDGIEWRFHDWREDLDFDRHVTGCVAVIHLGAEIWRTDRMERVNVEATRALVKAAARSGVKSFVFASSVAVYGSSKSPRVDESSPVVTAQGYVPSEYRGKANVLAYGRSKVLGEIAVHDACSVGAHHGRQMNGTILRPTVVVDEDKILETTRIGRAAKEIGANRRVNFVTLTDVAAAFVWVMEKNYADDALPGARVFNLSDDTTPELTYARLYRKLEALSDVRGLRERFGAPRQCYNLADMLRNKRPSRRLPLGMMHFPNDALKATGFRHPYGVEDTIARAARRLSNS
ncbi:NAD-dependent epimerase/dehydratase family protein [Mesorhizobium sp. CAU 1741]|uniref:NAD-dependent epimerase/dehydratase family protein n=1 Tax=Mesorhizobium sp. CAU 1741 TaxID=3140366 RepID=UPI00325AC5AF